MYKNDVKDRFAHDIYRIYIRLLMSGKVVKPNIGYNANDFTVKGIANVLHM